jgi:hypothetical protein
MTEDVTATRLLIAFSKGFGFRGLFESKISKLLATFEPGEVHLFQDDSKIGQNFFNERSIQVSNATLGNTRGSVKRSIDQYSHIIVFWDGDDLTDIVFFANLMRKNFRVIPIQLTKVRNKDKDERFDVYIGRGTPWGNPFPIGIGGQGDDRETVIEKFRAYFSDEILSTPEKKKAVLSLRGYRLGCHCKPLACHGDIIAAYLNSYEDDD